MVVHIKQCETDGNEVLTTEVMITPRAATLYHFLSRRLLPIHRCVLTCFFFFSLSRVAISAMRLHQCFGCQDKSPGGVEHDCGALCGSSSKAALGG